MLAALGILAYAASMMTHEALGHGVYCLAAGGHNTMLTGWMERCHSPEVVGPGMNAAGPGVQFGAGLLAWLVLYLLSPAAVRLRYFLWLYMAFDLLIASGYVAFSGITNFGDAAVLIRNLHPAAVWRGLLVLTGSAVYYLSMWLAAVVLGEFAGIDKGSSRLSRLVWIPYVTVAVFACCSAALNQTMGKKAAIGMAVASSFGAGTGLLFLPNVLRGMALRAPKPAGYLTWSTAWVLAAAAVLVAFLFYIGPGLE